MKKILNLFLCILSLLTLVTGIYISHFYPNYFNSDFMSEDSFIEYLEVIIFLIISFLSLYRLVGLPIKSKKSFSGHFFFFILFLFGAGEEISWGQRLFFNDSLPDFFITNNKYTEFNLHDLDIDGFNLSKVIFTDLLTFVLFFHLILSPILYRYNIKIRNVINDFKVPIPLLRHSLIYIIIFFSVMLFIGPLAKDQSELIEITGGIIYLSIFIYPLNRKEIDNA